MKFLFFTLLLLSFTAYSQPLPAWTKGQRAKVSKHYLLARDLYHGTGNVKSLSPENRAALGKKVSGWLSENSSLVNRQPMVGGLMRAYLIPHGYRNGDPRQVCLSLEIADEFWSSIDQKGKGRDLVQYLKEYFEIDGDAVPRMRESWYPMMPQNQACFENGCDETPPPDRDGDRIPDDRDRCPDDPGELKFEGCPDTDGDQLPDLDDRCPELAGPSRNHGCPVKTITTPSGGELEIGIDRATYKKGGNTREDVSAFKLVRQLIADGEFNTKNLELEFVSGTDLAEDFHGSEYLLLQLTMLDSLRHQVIQFPTGNFRINQNQEFELWSAFNRAIQDFQKSIKILRLDFGMYRPGDFLILSQGKADQLPMTGKPFPADFDHAMLTNFPVYEFTSPNTFTQNLYTLNGLTYGNEDLPFLRSAWLIYQLHYNPAFENYQAQMRIMKGMVVPRTNIKERNGTLYVAIHMKRLEEVLAKLQTAESTIASD